MTKNEYLKELNNAFKDFVFFPSDHHYEYKGKTIGISVTKFIGQYVNEFDKELIANKVAKRDNKTVEEILNAWEQKNNWACKKGTYIHEYIQALFSEEPDFSYLPFDEDKEKQEIIKICLDQCINFYEDYKKSLVHLADEFVIGSSEFDIASAIDHLFINKVTGGLLLVDYKTNSDIYKNEKYAKKMKAPLHHLKDTTLNHYFIQLSIYKFIVERYTNLKIEKMLIVWFSENNDNYKIIEVPFLGEEVEKILNWRLFE